jgi:hypothetical protein
LTGRLIIGKSGEINIDWKGSSRNHSAQAASDSADHGNAAENAVVTNDTAPKPKSDTATPPNADSPSADA